MPSVPRPQAGPASAASAARPRSRAGERGIPRCPRGDATASRDSRRRRRHRAGGRKRRPCAVSAARRRRAARPRRRAPCPLAHRRASGASSRGRGRPPDAGSRNRRTRRNGGRRLDAVRRGIENGDQGPAVAFDRSGDTLARQGEGNEDRSPLADRDPVALRAQRLDGQGIAHRSFTPASRNSRLPSPPTIGDGTSPSVRQPG